MSIKLGHSIVVLATILSVSACSNNSAQKTAKQKKIIKHRVEIKAPSNKVITKQEQSYASLLDQWNKEDLAPKQAVVASPKRVVEAKSIPAKRVVKTRLIVKAKSPVIKKRIVQDDIIQQYIAQNNNATSYKTPSYKAPVNNIKYASLSGDYANNPQTKSFINKMVSKHGFDRGYINYLLSNTEATPFLKKMAYKDSIYKKNSSKKTKSRSGRWNRYRDNFLTKRTINKGVEFWQNNKVALKRAELTYGVPQEYILGIIGVETRYGGNVGKNKAINALAAMGFNNPRRGKYFRSELEAYLLMTREEGLDPLKPMSSFAGALGLSQFMPSNIKRYAVDHDRSGSVNLWTPHDAIGSVANYFKKHGWQAGGTVAVPATYKNNGYKNLKTGFKSKHSLTNLKSRGVSANRLGNISGKANLIKLNTYNGDELWLGGHNFYVITRYNHSSHYAMAVHQLAEEINKRIGGKSQIRQASIESILQGLN